MNSHLLAGGLRLLLLSGSFLLPTMLEGERLVHRPEAGTELVRTYRIGGSMRMTEFKIEANGEEHQPEDVPELQISGKSHFVVRDELLEVEDGDLRKLRRSYETLEDSRSFTGPAGENESERESELDGETVVFTWDEAAGEWKATAEDEELDADLLDELRVDLSLAELLPPDEVEEDASWTLPGSAAALLLQPLGELGLRAEQEPEGDAARRLSRRLQESLTGSIEVTYRGTREEEGGLVLAVLELEIEVQLAASIEVPEAGTQEVAIERELAGELLWNTAAGRLHSLNITGETVETTTQTRQMPTPDGEIEVRQRQVFEGDRSYTIEVAAG